MCRALNLRRLLVASLWVTMSALIIDIFDSIRTGDGTEVGGLPGRSGSSFKGVVARVGPRFQKHLPGHRSTIPGRLDICIALKLTRSIPLYLRAHSGSSSNFKELSRPHGSPHGTREYDDVAPNSYNDLC